MSPLRLHPSSFPSTLLTTLPSTLGAEACGHGSLLESSLIGIGKQRAPDNKDHNFYPNSFVKCYLSAPASRSSTLCWKVQGLPPTWGRSKETTQTHKSSNNSWAQQKHHSFPEQSYRVSAGQERYVKVFFVCLFFYVYSLLSDSFSLKHGSTTNKFLGEKALQSLITAGLRLQ